MAAKKKAPVKKKPLAKTKAKAKPPKATKPSKELANTETETSSVEEPWIGRPPIVIDDELLGKAESLAAQGLNLEQIAYSLNMGVSTLYEKKKDYPEFVEAIDRGKAKGVAQIANRMFTKALTGDNTCMIFYLKAQGGWRDNLDINLTGSTTILISDIDSQM